MAEGKDQIHPQYRPDRLLIDGLMATGEPDELQLCELARMLIRYQGFPGGRDIQQDCDKVMRKWGLDEATLFERTRQILARGGVYQGRGKGEDSEWGTGGSAFDTAE